MRAGTQALIQALQAIPWSDSDNDDDIINRELDAIESESDEEDDKPGPRKAILPPRLHPAHMLFL